MRKVEADGTARIRRAALRWEASSVFLEMTKVRKEVGGELEEWYPRAPGKGQPQRAVSCLREVSGGS